jgi:hypothetical protein
MKRAAIVAVIVIFLLSGCASIDTTSIEQAAYKEGYAAGFSDGVASVTPTPAPTPTPIPTPTPYPYGRLSTLTAMAAVNELIDHGADITNIIEYDENTDPNEQLGRPNCYTQKVNFTFNGKYEGTVEIFEDIEDATARAEYIETISASAPAIGYYVFQHDLAVFRLELNVLPSDADAFDSILDELDVMR